MQKPVGVRQGFKGWKRKSGWTFWVDGSGGKPCWALLARRRSVIGFSVLVAVLGLLTPFIGFVRATYAQVTPQCVTPPSGMVSWWGGDGNANDIIATNHGTLMNGTTFAAGKVGQAFSFDGANDYIFVPNTVNIDGGTEATYDAWVFPESAPAVNTYYGIFGAGDATQPVWTTLQCRLLYWKTPSSPADTAKFYMDCGTSDFDPSYIGRYTAQDYPINNWYSVAGVFNNGTLDIYVNGALDNGASVGINSGTLINTNANNYVWIGAAVRSDQSLTGVHFDGLIDEVEIFSRALSAEEIAAIANAGSAGKCRSCVTPPPNMISWWKAEDNGDDSIDTNDGTLMNGATYAPGMVGQAFSVDGTDDYVNIPDSASLDVTTALTLDAWIKPAGAGTGNGIIIMKNPLKYALVWFPATQKVTFSLDIGGWADYVSTSSAPVGQWTHIAGTYDGSSVKIYINGVLDAEFPKIGSIATSTGDLTIGRRTDSPAEFFNGLIDEVEIFDRALTADEIAAIANARNAGKCEESEPVADLSVTKTDDPDSVTLGTNLTYTVTVMNNGPDPATGVTLTDTLPGGVTFVSVSPGTPTCTYTAGVVTCDLGTLANGDSADVTIVVTPTAAGTIENTATVAANETDPDPDNNTAQEETTVDPATGPDLTGAWNGVYRTCRRGRCMLLGTVRVRNQGTQPAPRSTLRIYLSVDAAWDPGDTRLQATRIRALQPGQGTTVPLAARLPRGVDPTGQYVIAVIDAGDEVVETDENNNQPITGPLP